MRVLWTAIPALLAQIAWTQQPAGTHMYVDYPGLSDTCKEALATNVTCPPFLPIVSFKNSVLDIDEVNELCVNDCYTSLERARAAIQAACSASTDVIVYDSITYPATFIADNYLLTYNVSCNKDRAGNFCDPQFLSLANQSSVMNSTFQCSDCWLGVLALQLNNPLGYDDGLASNFASLSSSCNATGYSFTSPTAYALNTTVTTASPTATIVPTCTGVYTVQATNDYKQLDLYCQNFATTVNTTLCIPPQCTTYTWKASDTCDSVVSRYSDITLPQFFAWNPNFNSLCLNSPFFIGYEVCVSPPGGYLNHTTGTASATTGAGATSVMPAPTNAMDGSNRNCSQWYTVVEGDTCALVSLAQSISLADFYFLNPEINQNCTNLALGESYCVKPVGSIATYPNYTVTGVLPITVPPATFSSVNTAIPTKTNDPGYIYTPPPLLPTASGTIPGCYLYENPSNYTTLCRYFAYLYGISTDQLLAWNPSLDTNISSCSLSLSKSYCVLQYENSTAPSDDITTHCYPGMNATEAGTTSNCNCFSYVMADDAYNDYRCVDFASDYEVTMSELLTWNSWLTGDCDTALYANLNESATRAVCIGTGNATPAPTTTMSETTTQTTASLGPTQTGIISGCQKFHTVQSGDTCISIESKYGITAAQFYQWNPSIGSTCTNLWLGYAYCVEGPASSTTTTGPNAPTQTGIAANCNKYYTVVSGDSCAKVEAAYGITFAQLYQWNPAIGSDCQTLVIGYAVCVGVSS